jgi:cysteine desulfurase
MQHFFVSPEQVREEKIYVEGSDVNHMKNVLRMKTGEELTIGDGDGWLYLCVVESYEEDMAVLKILEKKKDESELPSKIYLFQGLPKQDKMELIVQKAVELGVYQVIPVATKRAVVKLDAKKAKKKVERWQQIAVSAAKQAGRGIIPAVGEVCTYAQALKYAEELDVVLIPYELAEGMEETKQIIAEIRPGQSVGIFIGPEGGFEKEEVEQAVKAGAEPLTLGKRILRTETAGLTMLSVLMFHLEGERHNLILRMKSTGSEEMKEVYLDNSATTMAYRSVGELVQKVMCEDYGNPSSMHNKGVEAEKYIKEAKETFARLWKVQEKEVYFTSGGTESDNMALIGAARANKRAGNHLITSSIEHPAIINTMRFLEEEEGFRVTYLPVDQYGRIRLDALQEALCEDTILVSIMYVNNEVGSVQPIQEAASIVKAYNKDILFHVDAVQGFGKYKIYPKKLKVDMCSVSGHKIHGPKGVGALYIGENVKIRPIVYGGGQQHDMRSGTENVPGIAGLSLAAKTIYDNLDKKVEKMRRLKQHFIEGVEKIENTTIHGLYDETSAPHIISVGIAGIRSEVLLHALEDKGIYVSSGSACASNHPQISGVLKGIGARQEFLDATLRFSMSEFTTMEEIDYTLDALYNIVPMLRRYTRH